MRIRRFLILTTGALVVAAPVLADPPWARGGNDRHEGRRDEGHGAKRYRHESFNDDDRRLVGNFYGRNPGFVPPGLAKKGGVPPGLAKKGQVLEPQHQHLLLPLPPDLEKLLPPPPHEVIRRIIGHDMVLIHKQTNKVLDVLHNALP